MKNRVLFCLGLMTCPLFVHSSATVAFSPSTPGQPLIFHHKKPSVSLFEQKVLEQLSEGQLAQLHGLSDASIRFSKGVLGLVASHFLPDSEKQEKNLELLYNRDIQASINQIDGIFPGGKLAKLMNQTLSSYVEIANQMLHNVSDNALFHKDYQKMQVKVINRFKAKLEKITPSTKKTTLLQAEADSALEGMVSCLSLNISATESLVDGGQSVYSNMVLARQQLIKNVTVFVEAAFVLEVITNYKKCGP